MKKNNLAAMTDDELHRWLCHPERSCKDGCDDAAIPARMKIFDRELAPITADQQ